MNALTPRQRALLRAAERRGLIRGRTGWYEGFATTGRRWPATLVTLASRQGLLAAPDGAPDRRVLTAAGQAALVIPNLPASAGLPRAYKD